MNHNFNIGDTVYLGAQALLVVGFIKDGILTETTSPFLNCLLLPSSGQQYLQMALHHSILSASKPRKKVHGITAS